MIHFGTDDLIYRKDNISMCKFFLMKLSLNQERTLTYLIIGPTPQKDHYLSVIEDGFLILCFLKN